MTEINHLHKQRFWTACSAEQKGEADSEMDEHETLNPYQRFLLRENDDTVVEFINARVGRGDWPRRGQVFTESFWHRLQDFLKNAMEQAFGPSEEAPAAQDDTERVVVPDAVTGNIYTQEQRRRYWAEIRHDTLKRLLVIETGLPTNPSLEQIEENSETFDAFMENHDGAGGFPRIALKQEFTEEDVRKAGNRGLARSAGLVVLGCAVFVWGCLATSFLGALFLAAITSR